VAFFFSIPFLEISVSGFPIFQGVVIDHVGVTGVRVALVNFGENGRTRIGSDLVPCSYIFLWN